MCGLFGFLNYGDKAMVSPKKLVDALGYESTARGTDATGFAFIEKGEVKIVKAAVEAWNMKYDECKDAKAVIGHTRRTTKGTAKNNYNNHPFLGTCGDKQFAFAHNGVLSNDSSLRVTHKLPNTKILTDSYVAVQMIETQPVLNHEALKFMAEKVEGSFAFTILDQDGNLHIVKKDSPFVVAHFKELKLYVYASTDEILFKALAKYGPTRTAIIDGYKKGSADCLEILEPDRGDIWTISTDGVITKSTFTPATYTYYRNSYWESVANYTGKAGASNRRWYGNSLYSDYYDWHNDRWGGYGTVYYGKQGAFSTKSDTEAEIERELMAVAKGLGITEDEIQLLREVGKYSSTEIENMLYDYSAFAKIDECKTIKKSTTRITVNV